MSKLIQHLTKYFSATIVAIIVTMSLTSKIQAQDLPTFGEPMWSVPAGSVPWLSNAGNQVRGVAFNPATGNLLVPSRADGIRIERINTSTGESIGTMNTTGIAGGLLPINRIAVTEDGQIFAINLILESGIDFIIWYWEDEDATPQPLYEGKPTPNDRYGDGIGVRGVGDDIELFVSGTFNSNIAVFSFDGTVLNSTPRVIEIPQNAANANIVPIAGTPYGWINGRDEFIRKINLETGARIASVNDQIISTSVGDMDYIAADGREYLVTGVPGIEENTFYLIDITDVSNPQILAESGNIGLGENLFRVGGVTIDRENKVAYVLATNIGLAAFDLTSSMQIAVSVEDIDQPRAFTLEQNFPNPFNPATRIHFTLPHSEHVRITVHNMLGQQVYTLIDEARPAGSHTVQFNGSNLSSGVYIYRMQAGNFTSSMRMTLLK
ncbi:MAG: T9SS type A sorting domain-containing protein [Bacteroidetes bacterium]|nr:T9SS type A sorting domain-containing protein [Bacteroidota bacterium]MCH8524428.1 T9SS type A sorting domain-containing protein [Balneolales bacterium]